MVNNTRFGMHGEKQVREPLPDFILLLSQHKRPEFMIGTQQSDIDRLIRMYIVETKEIRNQNNGKA